jgi:hypothetical protein
MSVGADMRDAMVVGPEAAASALPFAPIPVTDWPVGMILLHAVFWQAASMAWLAVHIMVVIQFGVAGGALTLLLVLLLYRRMPLAGLFLFFQVLLY